MLHSIKNIQLSYLVQVINIKGIVLRQSNITSETIDRKSNAVITESLQVNVLF